MPGFIKNSFDIKLILLYVLSNALEPPTFDEVAQVALCDEGVDYFLLKQSMDELLPPENITVEDGRYAITPRGQQNLESWQDQLPLSLRQHCDQGLVALNRELRTQKFLKAKVSVHPDTTCSLQLEMSDPTGTILSLNLLTPHRKEAEAVARAFQQDSSKFYHGIMERVTQITQEIQGENQD